jgi:hypothetical protein
MKWNPPLLTEWIVVGFAALHPPYHWSMGFHTGECGRDCDFFLKGGCVPSPPYDIMLRDCDFFLKELCPTFGICYNSLGLRAMEKRSTGALRFIGIGWFIALSILLFTLGGRWVGQQVGGSTSVAIFTILGVLLGLAVATVGIYRMMKPMLSEGGQGDGSED